EERAMVRTVNSTYSVIEVWRRLVAAADFNVLRLERRALRKEDKYSEADRLFLKWPQEGEKRDGPAYSITNSLCEKVEATAADIIVILTALYQRADDIPAPPLTRMSFHNAVLELGIGGFRLGCLQDTKFWQYTISLVRDPDDPTRVRPIVTSNILRNKTKETQKTCKYKKSKSVAHSSTLVPYPLLCQASLVITRAIQMDALDTTSFGSARELFQRPVLGKTDRIDIPWKEKFRNEIIFPLKYAEFWALWHRCLVVIGSRKHLRPYSLRVGAGARIDGILLPRY
ncbi:hypothetical protein C8A03DRAFT_19623, partial [Achaetomium macrosporum]